VPLPHVTAKIKIEGNLTAEQKNRVTEQTVAMYHRMIEGIGILKAQVNLQIKF
jgi:hypothetical protein